MAGTKITDFPTATVPLTGTEIFPVVQGGVTKQTTINQTTANSARILANIAALQALNVATTSLPIQIQLTSNYVAGDGGGVFRYDSTDTTTADNGGTVIVDATGRRWKRQYSGAVDVRWFGAVGNGATNDAAAFQAAGSIAANVQVTIPAGTYLLSTSPAPTGSCTWIFNTGASTTGAGVLPGRIIKLGVSPNVLDLSTSVAGTNLINAAYGTAAAPAAFDPAFGYSGANFTVNGTPGTGTADPLNAAISGLSYQRAGTRGIACGAYLTAQCLGTWGPGSSQEAGAVALFTDGTTTRGGTVFGAGFHANATTTVGAVMRGIEVDTISTVSNASKIGVEIVSPAADTGSTTGIVTIDGGAALEDSAGIRLFAVTGGVGYSSGIMTIKRSDTAAPVKSGGALWNAGGFTTNAGLDWRSMTFSTAALWLKNNENITWRNAANSANIVGIKVNSSDLVAIADGKLTVNPSNGAAALAGTITVTATGSDGLFITRAAGTDRLIAFQTAGSNRWRFGAESTAESGSDVGTNFRIYRYSDGGSFLGTPFQLDRSNGYVALEGAYAQTTASAANMFVDSSGNIMRSTSSEKYKDHIEPLQDEFALSIVMAANSAAIWYRSKCKADNPTWGWYGFSAEKLAETCPQFVHFRTTRIEHDQSEDGEITSRVILLDKPEPEGVAYERMVVPLVRHAANQERRIRLLEAKLERLIKLQALFDEPIVSS